MGSHHVASPRCNSSTISCDGPFSRPKTSIIRARIHHVFHGKHTATLHRFALLTQSVAPTLTVYTSRCIEGKHTFSLSSIEICCTVRTGLHSDDTARVIAANGQGGAYQLSLLGTQILQGTVVAFLKYHSLTALRSSHQSLMRLMHFHGWTRSSRRSHRKNFWRVGSSPDWGPVILLFHIVLRCTICSRFTVDRKTLS